MKIITEIKETRWYKCYYDVDDMLTTEEIIDGINLNLFDNYYGKEIDDSVDFLPPEENDNQPTLIIYNEKYELIWDNTPKFL